MGAYSVAAKNGQKGMLLVKNRIKSIYLSSKQSPNSFQTTEVDRGKDRYKNFDMKFGKNFEIIKIVMFCAIEQ